MTEVDRVKNHDIMRLGVMLFCKFKQRLNQQQLNRASGFSDNPEDPKP
jgi:hypothetical protein